MGDKMNNEKRGNFLRKLRKSKKMTQAQLGDLINYTDKNISKWENGISFPTDPETLAKLSSIFNVSFEELLYGDFKNEDNLKQVTESTLKAYSDNYKSKIKFKKFMYLSLVTLLIFTVVFLLTLYFVFIRGKIQSFKISGETKNGSLINGSLLVSNDISILNFNKINNDDNIKNIELYIVYENNEKIIFNGENDNYYIEEKNGSKEYKLREIPENELYVKIYYNKDENEMIKLSVEKKYINNDVLPQKTNSSINDNESTNTNAFEKKFIESGFNINNGYYKKKINKYVTISINAVNKSFVVEIKKDNVLERISSNNYTNVSEYEKFKNGDIIDNKEIELSEKLDCLNEKCNTINDYVKYINFLKEYLK